jgi:ferredoxin-NADP reductase
MPAERYEATLERIHEWTPSTRSFFLRLAPGRRMPFHAGQFISLQLPVGDSPPLVRPYSLASDPDAELLEVCVDHVPGGLGSEYLFSLGRGAALSFKGAFGTFMVDEPPAATMVCVGDGTGIAPIRGIVRRALARGARAVEVLQGAPTEAELLFRDELVALARAHPALAWQPVLTGAGPDDQLELERLVLERYVQADDDRTRHFWICAVGEVVRRLREALRAAGYERRAIRYEQW